MQDCINYSIKIFPPSKSENKYIESFNVLKNALRHLILKNESFYGNFN